MLNTSSYSLNPQNDHVKFTLLTKLPPHGYCPLLPAWHVCDLGKSPPLWIQASGLQSLLQGVLAPYWRRTMPTLNSAHLLLSGQDLPLTEPFLDIGTWAKHLTHTFLTLVALFSVLNTVKWGSEGESDSPCGDVIWWGTSGGSIQPPIGAAFFSCVVQQTWSLCLWVFQNLTLGKGRV